MTKIDIKNWRCNGSINSLIRNFVQLKKITQTEKELNEAIRWMKIELECFFKLKNLSHDDQTIAEIYFENKSLPRWKLKGMEILPGLRTVAQVLAKKGNQDCLAKCNDFEDLIYCLELVGDYNEFNSSETIQNLKNFNKKIYYNENNLNNGKDLFDYWFGWEGSHVFYVGFNHQYHKFALAPDYQNYYPYPVTEFEIDCGILAKNINANEFEFTEQNDTVTKSRFWFD